MAAGFSLVAVALPSIAKQRPVAPAASPELDQRTEMANVVVAKSFCVAFRRADRERLHAMIAPDYLERHDLSDRSADLPIEIAPVRNIHNIIVAGDGETVLCHYTTDDGSKESMVLRTVEHDGRRYILPSAAPNTEDKTFQAWILRTNLDRFCAL